MGDALLPAKLKSFVRYFMLIRQYLEEIYLPGKCTSFKILPLGSRYTLTTGGRTPRTFVNEKKISLIMTSKF